MATRLVSEIFSNSNAVGLVSNSLTIVRLLLTLGVIINLVGLLLTNFDVSQLRNRLLLGRHDGKFVQQVIECQISLLLITLPELILLRIRVPHINQKTRHEVGIA